MKILNARDAAKATGYSDATTSKWLVAHSQNLFNSKLVRFQCTGELSKKYSVYARVDAGRWLADCPICSRSNYVDPDEPVFYCFGCGNQGSGKFVPVIFPEEREEIESLLLARAVTIEETDDNLISQAINAVPVIAGHGRDWNNEMSVDDLKQANKEKKVK